VSIVPSVPAEESGVVTFHFAGIPVRAKMINGNPWFVAADVATALAIDRHRDALSVMDEDEKMSDEIAGPGNTGIAVHLISESGLYRMIFRARKAEAQTFTRWVTREVLPSIRKTGQYVPQQRVLSPRELAQMVIDAEDRAAAALVERDDAWAAVSDRDEKIRLDAPKVGYVEHFVDPVSDHCTIRTLATELGVSERKLFAYLRGKTRIYQDANGEYHPYADWKTCFTLRDRPDAPRHRDGRMRTTLYVTPVGKESIRRWLAKDPIS